MKNYQIAVRAHLATYAKRHLGVFEEGSYKGRPYAHILPASLRFLNFLEAIRAELQDHLLANPSIKLHQYFHHLNSSQAFAFNLFYPYFVQGGHAARALSTALGIEADVVDSSWKFEQIRDEKEGTSVDVTWCTADGVFVFCEVKFSEGGFGTADNDARHRKKLLEIYRPRLKSLVSADLLEETTFFQNYQILRNISLLAENAGHQLIVLFPRENESLDPLLRKVLARVNPNVRARIKVSYVEDCLKNLQEDTSLSPELHIHAFNLARKYILPSMA